MDKTFLKKTFLLFGGDALLRSFNHTPRVLFWHGVDNRVNPDVEQEIFDIDVFKQQIAYLKKHYEIISIEEFEKRYRIKEFTGKEVVLTFDDGYANNLYVVAPILNQLNLPFTVFVSTEHIDSGAFFPTSVNRIITKGAGLKKICIPSKNLQFDLDSSAAKNNACNTISDMLKTLPVNEVKEITNDLISNVSVSVWEELKSKYKSVRPMTWDEVKELSEKGATIGSHCMWHICCHDNQDKLEVKTQLEESKKYIENNLQKECRYFAYPNGDNTVFSNRIVNSIYALGFSTKGTRRIVDCKDSAIVPRIGEPGILDTFKIITNLYPKKK